MGLKRARFACILLFITAGWSSAFAQVITSFSPLSAPAGTGTVLTINGTGFGAAAADANRYVTFKSADNGGFSTSRPDLSQYVSWTDTQIRVKVPSAAGSGVIGVVTGATSAVSAAALQIPYALQNVNAVPFNFAKLVNRNGTGGYTLRMSAAFDANTAEKQSFLRALNTWRCAIGVNFEIGAVTSVATSGNDGVNVITNGTLSAGTLAITRSNYLAQTAGKWEQSDVDIIFGNYAWNYGPALPAGNNFDFEETALHELGHAIGLAHVTDSADVMYWSASTLVQRSPGANNLAGTTVVMNLSTAADADYISGPMTLRSNGTCTPPTITSFTPSSALSGASVTITGTNFLDATAVAFGGVPATSFVINSATSITAVVDAGATGSISVDGPGGSASKTGFTYATTPPVITSFTPAAAATGASVTITGNYFLGATAVSFGGTAASGFTVNTNTSITATVAAGTTGPVSVTTPGGTTTLAGFTYLPPPTITSFTPVSGATGAIVTITGTAFVNVTAVKFGGTDAASFTVISPTSITAVVARGASGNISVTASGGTATRAGFTYVSSVPTVISFAPAAAHSGDPVTITGTNFTGATAVSFGGTAAASFTVQSATTISAIVGAGASGSISVTTPGGTGTASGFVFTQPAPTIASFTPTSAAAGGTVTLTGTNLTGATAVSFGGTAASSFTIVSATSITAVVATGTSGTVSVTTPGGTASLAGFTFTAPASPAITSFTPSSGASGTTVTITGTNLTGATAVSFGGTAASSFSVQSPATITAVVAGGASGSVSVTTPGGTITKTGFTYTGSVASAPTITSFTPSSAIPGATVTIIGTNLAGATAVSFGGTAAASFTVNSSTVITAVLAAGASGNVSVTTPGGTATLAGFTFLFTLPATNFKISTTDETCKNLDNGVITITAVLPLSYTATVTGVKNITQLFTNSLELKDFPAGSYSVCITVNGQSTFSQCFNLVIREPKDLALLSTINTASNTLSLVLDGGSTYHIQLNGMQYTTTSSQVQLPLLKGNNTLSVTTDKPCQGTIEKQITVESAVFVYPNPFQDKLVIDVGKDPSKTAKIGIRTASGKLVSSSIYPIDSGSIDLDLSKLAAGIYLLSVKLDHATVIQKISKK